VCHYECQIDADALRRVGEADAKGNRPLSVEVDMRDAKDGYLDGFYCDMNLADPPAASI
jgi:hypothetical protein